MPHHASHMAESTNGESRARARDLGLVIGQFAPGPMNAITDVSSVAVGHTTVIEGTDIRTGVTIIDPCSEESVLRRKVPAGVSIGHGFGKTAGLVQVMELGQIESPIALTNTLAVGSVLDAMVREVLSCPAHDDVRSINVVVGETNDGYLNDIRSIRVEHHHVSEALQSASTGPVDEGGVGAGTGTVCFGYKGGIGTSSRVVPLGNGAETRYTLGVLVQTNFGRSLTILGRPFPAGESLESGDGSCMIIVATDAPLDSRQLGRLAKRSLLGMVRTGSVMSHGSGDLALAFSTGRENRIPHGSRHVRPSLTFPEDRLTPLFAAVMEATEEAILNSLFMARTTTGYRGRTVCAIDLARVRSLMF